MTDNKRTAYVNKRALWLASKGMLVCVIFLCLLLALAPFSLLSMGGGIIFYCLYKLSEAYLELGYDR